MDCNRSEDILKELEIGSILDRISKYKTFGFNMPTMQGDLTPITTKKLQTTGTKKQRTTFK